MKKYCPFCDSELSETLWCEQCGRYAILYNTYSAAAENNRGGGEIERRELYRRLTAALKSLYAAKSKSSASAPAGKPILPAVPEDAGEKPGKDTPKIILLGSMLAVCLVLCLVVCAHLVQKRGATTSGTDRTAQNNTQNEHDTEGAVSPAEEPGERVPPEVSVSDEPSPQPSGEAPAQPADEIQTPDETELQSAAETPTPDETAVQPAEGSSSEAPAAEAGWKQLEQLDPLDLQIYGDTKYYYYAGEDIEALGLQCTYYHLGIHYTEAADAIRNFFGEAASEEEPYDNTYFNSYVDGGYEYYTSFQQILSYDCGELRCSVNYDTGSGIVHFISFSGANIEDHAELIREIAALASPEYAVSAEALQEDILSVEDILLHLDPPDMWHEEYVYQDSCISLSMTYSDGIYELQATSREYADDVMQNTLSISRPK